MTNDDEVRIAEIELGLRAEYDQTWQDFRHRTTVEMTILGVYFATVAGLVFTFTQASSGTHAAWTGFLVGIIGVLLSIGTIALLLGERRPWSADVVRLKELESLLSRERIHQVRLARTREYDRLWTTMRYGLSLSGSFTWYIFIVILTGTVFGSILGNGLVEVMGLSRLLLTILSILATSTVLVAVTALIMLGTISQSQKALLQSRERQQSGPGKLNL